MPEGSGHAAASGGGAVYGLGLIGAPLWSVRDGEPAREAPVEAPLAWGSIYSEVSLSETSLASARLVITYTALTAPTGTTQASQQPVVRSSSLACPRTGFSSGLSDWIASTGEISAIRLANSTRSSHSDSTVKSTCLASSVLAVTTTG